MRKHIPIIALIFLLVLPSLASAVYLDSVTGTADCNGWNTDVEITFRSGARLVRLEYVVVLSDATGTETDRFEYSEEVPIPDQVTVIYPFGEMWTSTLPDGPYSMTCTVVLFDIFPDGQNRFEDGFTVEFECGGGTGDEGGDDPVVIDFRARGTGYWKNHPLDWPVTELDLGGETLDQAALLDILGAPPRGDATVILARALITAKLNLAGGGAGDIADVIAAADAYLAGHPVFSNPRGADRRAALDFMEALGEYNSRDCSGDTDITGETFAPDAGKSESMVFDKAASVEVIPLGSLKALFR